MLGIVSMKSGLRDRNNVEQQRIDNLIALLSQ